jgi:hypothetical protein
VLSACSPCLLAVTVAAWIYARRSSHRTKKGSQLSRDYDPALGGWYRLDSHGGVRLDRGANDDELQRLAVKAQLVWPKGSMLERTEFDIDDR